MRRSIISSFGIILLISSLQLTGCSVGSTHGTKLSSDEVSHIVKGKTTSSEIYSMFGSPMLVQDLPTNGERMLVYTYRSSNTKANAKSFIPIYGAFAGGSNSSMQQQTLTITLNKRGIVKDYKFDNKTTFNETTKEGLFHYNTKTYVKDQ